MVAKIFRFGPSDSLPALLARNKAWASSLNRAEPQCLPSLAGGQSPSILWIGCSDSRVGEYVLDLLPGEVFTHRNVANVINSNDLSSQAVLQYAIEVVGIKHVLVVGHTDCGGVKACLYDTRNGIVDYWLKTVREVRSKNEKYISSFATEAEKVTALVELNVQNTVKNVLANESVQDGLKKGLQVHGLVYNSGTGIMREIEVQSELDPVMKMA